MKKAVIIGAGIAGIATSLRLKKKGYAVSVYESNSYPGGKLTAFKQAGFRFDAGPSLFTMPNLVDELFELFGAKPKNYFQYKRKETICNYFWEDGLRFSATADKEQFVQEASRTFKVPAIAIADYLKGSEKKYTATAPVFSRKVTAPTGHLLIN